MKFGVPSASPSIFYHHNLCMLINDFSPKRPLKFQMVDRNATPPLHWALSHDKKGWREALSGLSETPFWIPVEVFEVKFWQL